MGSGSAALRRSAAVSSAATQPAARASDTGSVNQSRNSLAGDSRGTTTVEYAVVLVLVTVGGALAVGALGVALIERFRLIQVLIGMPIP